MAFRLSRQIARRAPQLRALYLTPIAVQQIRNASTSIRTKTIEPVTPLAWKAGALTLASAAVLSFGVAFAAENVDYVKLRADIVQLLTSNPQYEDGSYG